MLAAAAAAGYFLHNTMMTYRLPLRLIISKVFKDLFITLRVLEAVVFQVATMLPSETLKTTTPVTPSWLLFLLHLFYISECHGSLYFAI